MGLIFRMAIYFAFAALASQGLVIFDAEGGTVTFEIEKVEYVLSGIVGYLSTYGVSRVGKKLGWNT